MREGRSVGFVDAPVSGGVNAAAAGTLTFMVGADSEAAFNRAKAILDSMGAKVRVYSKVFQKYSKKYQTFVQLLKMSRDFRPLLFCQKPSSGVRLVIDFANLCQNKKFCETVFECS